MDPVNRSVLAISRDPALGDVISRQLGAVGFEVRTAGTAVEALGDPASPFTGVVIIDEAVNDCHGFDICKQFQKSEHTAYLPVLYLAAPKDEFCSKVQAFTSGIVDILTKPVDGARLLTAVHRAIALATNWRLLTDDAVIDEKLQLCEQHARSSSRTRAPLAGLSDRFPEFVEWLARQRGRTVCHGDSLIGSRDLYSLARQFGITESQIARAISQFSGIPYCDAIMPHQIQFGVLPPRFCFQNQVLPLGDRSRRSSLVLANPFDHELVELLHGHGYLHAELPCLITEPANIALFDGSTCPEPRQNLFRSPTEAEEGSGTRRIGGDGDDAGVPDLARRILEEAVDQKATDIHLESKTCGTLVRFRIDGDLHDASFYEVSGARIITRFKVLSGMDIAESRRPQDGSLETLVRGRRFNLRVATMHTPHGECLKMRILEPDARAKDLLELGMNKEQCRVIDDLTNRTAGMVLIVGPAGSGKTTTLYGMLTHINYRTNSLITVEDPIEYAIPFAEQQQVNEKAGITYDVLLKAAVRQDPNMLFIGEIRDQSSARIAVDFTSTGHLTFSTLHTNNATTAFFRLERLGIDRSIMAENIIAIVAQRLLKILCPECKRLAPLDGRDRELLARYTNDVPVHAAYPVGCPACRYTGFQGRTGVFEVVVIDDALRTMIRQHAPIAEIRTLLAERGDYLIGHHAIDKVRHLLCSPVEVYSRLLVEEIVVPLGHRHAGAQQVTRGSQPLEQRGDGGILTLEQERRDDTELCRTLAQLGYAVDSSGDGTDALVRLTQKHYGLVISDMAMPDLEGLKLLELMHQQGIATPVLFLTDRPEDEELLAGRNAGRIDFVRRPVSAAVLDAKIRSLFIGT